MSPYPNHQTNPKLILKVVNRWKIGDGFSIPVWNNRWISDNSFVNPQYNGISPLAELRVSDCVLSDDKAWNIPFLHSIFDQHTVNHIINTPLYPSVQEDRLVWMKEDNSEYYLSSAYCLCVQELLDFEHFKVQVDWSLIWKLKIPLRRKTSFGKFVEIVCQLVFDCKIKESIVPLLTFCATLMRKIVFIYIFRCPSSRNI
jgi:hypothetical protein